MKRVVITGVGPVSGVGIGREAFAAGLKAGTVSPALAAFNVADYLESPKNYLDRSSELAFAALSLALEDANLDPKACGTAALLLGSAYGNLATMGLFFGDFAAKGPRLVKPVLFPHTYSNTSISLLAIDYNLAGYHANYAAGAVSAACAIAAAFDLIRSGRESLALAGGFESLNPLLVEGLKASGLGFTPGEGAGILVLEERERALARGAVIRGEVTGAGMAGGGNVAAAMAAAVRQAGWPGKPDLILASACGDAGVDAPEAEALKAFDVPVVRVKALTGETLGAGAALQVAAALASGAGRLLVNSVDAGGQAVSLAVEGAGA